MIVMWPECYREFDKDRKYFDEVVMDKQRGDVKTLETLSKINPPEQFIGGTFPRGKAPVRFRKTISFLGEDTVEFFKKHMDHISFNTTYDFKNGEATMEIWGSKRYIDRKYTSLVFYNTDKAYKQGDFIASCEQFGRIPGIINTTHKDYFEYGNVLPYFCSYLACKDVNEKEAYKTFLEFQLKDIQRDAKKAPKFASAGREAEYQNEKRLFSLIHNFNMRYVRSLDYALQLIERYEQDPSTVTQELRDYLWNSKNFIQIGEDLDISTEGCKKLLKETERYRR